MNETLESCMCDVIKVRLKGSDGTRSWKVNQPLNITAAERPILKLGLPNLRGSLYFILLLVASPIFRRIFMTSHMTLSSASPYFLFIYYYHIYPIIYPAIYYIFFYLSIHINCISYYLSFIYPNI